VKKQLIILLLSVLIYFPFQTIGQNEPLEPNSLNFFLDCYRCDFTFVRQELDFISFVRNPKLADVHILASNSQTGSGGRKYFLNFIGLNNLEGQNMEYEYFAEQSATRDEIRKGLLKLIKTGILQYYSKTSSFDEFEIDLKRKENKNAVELVDDPWDLWVFRVGAGGDFEKEARQSEFSISTEFSIEKVTDAWKTEIEGTYRTDYEKYIDDGEEIVNDQNATNISVNYIKSISPRWSAGIFGDYLSRTYLNIKNSHRLSAALEYNIFPWDVSNRKVFTIRYRVGTRLYSYNEETIYNKLNESLIYESLGLNLEMVQPWGRVEMRLEGRHYFHDLSKNRLTLESDFSVRVSKQLSVYCEIESEVIHDQLYLPKGDATLEDLLLKRRKLSTTYEVRGEIGFRFTFGSIYNNVVNERL
jgi:hypothetical protein